MVWQLTIQLSDVRRARAPSGKKTVNFITVETPWGQLPLRDPIESA
jgi:hypothetical protein